MKKFIAFMLAAACLMSCVPVFAAEEGSLANFRTQKTYAQGVFPDVKAEDWFSESVATVYELGLMAGNGKGEFNPTGNITYAETLVLASKLHNIYNGGDGSFELGDPWYANYVLYCLKNGIISVEFESYNVPVARGEFVSILSRALPESTMPAIREVAEDQIPDVKMDNAYAEAIYRFYRAGILSGNNAKGTFTPEAPIQRSAVARILSCLVYRSLRSKAELEVFKGPDLEKQTRAEDSFFTDAAILGNSLVDGLKIYSNLKNSGMTFYSGTSMTITSAMNNANRTLKNGRTGTLVQALCENTYAKIYIELGINEIYTAPDKFKEAYGSMVDVIRASNPDADIYFMAITPVTKARSDEGSFTMARIKGLNNALHELAAEKDCWYLDCCTTLCDSTGYLPVEYGGWDGSPHLAVSGYDAWAEVVRTYYVP